MRKSIPVFYFMIACLVFCSKGSADTDVHSPKTDPLKLTLAQAVGTALATHPDIRALQQDILGVQGDLEREQGRFDPVIRIGSGFDHSETPQSESLETDRLRWDKVSIELEVSKKLENGIVLSPNLTLASLKEPETYSKTQNTADLFFSVEIPLMQGKGRAVTMAGVLAAEKEHEAVVHRMHHRASVTIRTAAEAFWEYKYASARLNLLKQFEKNMESAVQNTRELILARELASGEFTRIEAELQVRVLARMEGEQTLEAARYTLGLAMGIDADQASKLPSPANDFIVPPDLQTTTKIGTDPLVLMAMEYRKDRLDLAAQVQAEKIRFHASADTLRPQIDLIVRAGYSGLTENGFSSDAIPFPGDSDSGASIGAGVNFVLPWHNHESRGKFIRQKSEYQKAKIRFDDLDRQITSGVRMVVLDYTSCTARLNRAKNMVMLRDKTLANEREKMRLGFSTLSDVLDADKSFVEARLSELSLGRDSSTAIVRLAYETGTLVKGKGKSIRISLDRITRLPEAWKKY